MRFKCTYAGEKAESEDGEESACEIGRTERRGAEASYAHFMTPVGDGVAWANSWTAIERRGRKCI
jgi:hypothetical protein